MSLPTCAQKCIPPNHTKGDYGCDFSNPDAPQCVHGKGSQQLPDCERNCKAPLLSKCNFELGTCQPCNATDPDCRFTTAYCNAACHKSSVLGIYRGIEISQVCVYIPSYYCLSLALRLPLLSFS